MRKGKNPVRPRIDVRASACEFSPPPPRHSRRNGCTSDPRLRRARPNIEKERAGDRKGFSAVKARSIRGRHDQAPPESPA